MLCVVSPLDVVDLTLAENGFQIQISFEILTRVKSESSDLDRIK